MDELLRKILNTTQACIFWKDTNQRYIGVNKAFLEYFGFIGEHVVLGKTMDELGFHIEPDNFPDEELRVLAGESTSMVPGKCIARGEERHTLVSKSPLYDENGTIIGIVGSFIDVTKQYDHETKIEELNKKLEASLKVEKHTKSLMNEFLSRMRLEIKKPVTAISSLSYIDRDVEDADRLRGDMAKIYASSHYLEKLTNDLLDIKAMEGERLKLEAQRIALSEITEGIETVASDIARTKNLIFTITRDFQPDLCLLCDPGRVQQVALNMIMNAINFTDSGGTVDVKISAETRQKKTRLTITVADSGCGISPAFLPQIFEPFSREKRNPNKYGTGTGLGLTVAKRLTKAMHGDITVDSEEELGSTFKALMVFPES